MNAHLSLAGPALLACALPFTHARSGNDWIIGSGTTVIYDTANGPVAVDNLHIEVGAILRVLGPQPFDLLAHESVLIDGTLDLSGFDAPPVFTLNTPQYPEIGARGGPAGGRGGTGSWNTVGATPRGGDGAAAVGSSTVGGKGGEGGWHPSSSNAGAWRRAAGGGGGVLGPDRPVVAGDLEDPANLGLVALTGRDGSSFATGSVSGGTPPQGGGVGSSLFIDGNPRNDFFGRKIGPAGTVTTGELLAPVAGQGGGAGGDAVQTDVFPPPVFIYNWHDKGGAGGGGGGLGLLQARFIQLGPGGRIVADGGAGGAGENTFFFNRIGGGGGGGAGGLVLLQARSIDLSAAGEQAISCRGGSGANGADDHPRAEGGGGHGGPGLIQLHVPGGDPAIVLLPPGVSLREISSPGAHVLDLEPGL